MATGELCSSRLVTLPSEICPNTPADDVPTTIMYASYCLAISSRPAGADRALCRSNLADTSPGRFLRANSSAWSAISSSSLRYSASIRAMPGTHGAGMTEQITSSSPMDRASMLAR